MFSSYHLMSYVPLICDFKATAVLILFRSVLNCLTYTAKQRGVFFFLNTVYVYYRPVTGVNVIASLC